MKIVNKILVFSLLLVFSLIGMTQSTLVKADAYVVAEDVGDNITDKVVAENTEFVSLSMQKFKEQQRTNELLSSIDKHLSSIEKKLNDINDIMGILRSWLRWH